MNERPPLTAILTVFLLAALLAACSPTEGVSSPSTNRALDPARTRYTIFVPNPELAEGAIRFRTLGATSTLFFEPQAVVFPLPASTEVHPWFSRLLGTSPSDPAKPTQPSMVRLQFIGANPDTQVVGQEQLPGIVNYFLGNDPDQWRTRVPTFGSVAYKGLYPGVDLVYNGDDGVLKGTFLVAPGANPSSIRWRYERAPLARRPQERHSMRCQTPRHGRSCAAHDEARSDAPKVELSNGELLIGADENGKNPLLIERKPVAWQTVAGKRTAVNVQYAVQSDGISGFALGTYDATQPLVIDPTLDYGTYWGFGRCDGAYDMALDSNNNVYITGTTNSQGSPANPNCTQNQYFDLFVTKLDPSKTGANQHIYTTYIGGNHFDLATGIGVDNVGNAYVAGYTRSTNFPTTTSAYQQNYAGSYEGVVIQLDATGNKQYASYLGGTGYEELWQMAVGNSPLVYVVGLTSSSNFPTTANAYSSTRQNRDAFVSVFDTTKSGNDSLVYSTLYGGSADDIGYAIAVSGGVIYFAGTTLSTNLPLKNHIQAAYGGDSDLFLGDVFAAILDPSQSGQNQLLFATYLGGSKDEIPFGVNVGNSGNMYLTGFTTSTDFPITTVSPAFGGDEDAFLAKLNVVAPTSLLYNRFVGGNGKDAIREVVEDSRGNAYVAGRTGSDNLQTIAPLQTTFKGGAAESTDHWWLTSRGLSDAMIAKFDPAGTMTFGSYLGGTGFDGAMGIRLGTDGKVYVAGVTRSSDFGTANAYQPTNAGHYDAFVVSIGGLAPAPTGGLYMPLILR